MLSEAISAVWILNFTTYRFIELNGYSYHSEINDCMKKRKKREKGAVICWTILDQYLIQLLGFLFLSPSLSYEICHIFHSGSDNMHFGSVVIKTKKSQQTAFPLHRNLCGIISWSWRLFPHFLFTFLAVNNLFISMQSP